MEKDSKEYWAFKLETWINDPWAWMCDVVWTKDAVDEKNPIKRFPKEFEYLRVFTRIWLAEKRIAVPKSRRMFMSWCCVSLHLWDALFHKGRNIAIVSKKEDDADEIVQRAEFILKNIKEADWPSELRPQWTKTFNKIVFPQLDSQIQGFPQGADQLRQFTFSRIMADEMAFWEKAREMYASTVPTLDGGGAITSISSAAPGFFKDLVHDELNPDDERTSPKHLFPAEGIEVWRNVKNKFVIFQLHYLADPRKRDPQYRADKLAEMPYSDFMQEYEISWETHSGKPVYMDWNKKIHGNKVEEFPEIGIPLVLGIDQGLTPACIVMQPKDEDLIVLREYTAENMGAERFKAKVIAALEIDYPEWPSLKESFIMGIDPTALNRRDVDERSYADVFAKDFRVHGGENGFDKRVHEIEKWLMKFKKGRPCFRVNLMNCPVLVRGFDGEYHYPDKMFQVEPNKPRPLKNFAANCHDALQYGATVLRKLTRKRRMSVPKPSYSFSGGEHGRNQR